MRNHKDSDTESLDRYWEDLTDELFRRRNGLLECWEYTNCRKQDCLAYNIRPGDFYLYGQKARCGVPVFDETFMEYLQKMASIMSRRMVRAAVAPVAALLGR